MDIISSSEKETLHIGKTIASGLRRGDIICLFGELGSGKTVLAKGIASGLGIKKEEVISPTFVLMRPYLEARLPFFHFDLYRLEASRDIMNIGYEEYFYDDGITVIEWADRLKRLLPEEHLGIRLTLKGPSERTLKFSASGDRYKDLLEKIREDIGA